MTVIFQPTMLNIVGDVAPEKVFSNTVPGGPFCPERSGVEPLNGGVSQLVLLEPWIVDDDVWIGVSNRFFSRPVSAMSLGDGCQGGSTEGCCGTFKE